MPYYVVMAIGGTILFIGVILMFYNIIALMRAPKGDANTVAEFPIAETAEEAEPTPRWLERWGVWVGLVIVLVLFAYSIPFGDMLIDPAPGSKPWVTW
jgi:cytochrome c oxidase subunit 1